ncbi:hypothetical protein CCACVL1_05744 [Corchorus capsularis]|uniref:F-box domain-containing protein n=1 Tax=Corchorus capsularis TaxID=210143 RepID=A0A1R3JJC6_COCAP|nr:hypothetical protein CCACVL1_05744 [Corchorus capsularis]
MVEQNVVKKKKKKYINNITFDDLPTELKVDILCRLSGKELVRLTCVSHSWQDFITVSCFPTMAALSYSGSIHVRKESSKPYRHEIFCYMLKHQSLNVDKSFGYVFLRTMEETHQYSDIRLAKLMASCNGLVLICRGDCHYPRQSRNTDGKVERPKILHDYYVINPRTDQFVKVPKPSPSVCCYAALAFHPGESRYFKIVRFQQGLKRLNVFNSETGDWANSSFKLEKDVTKAKWVEQSAYLQGAIYRLSKSGHMLRFTVDKVVNKKYMARAIDIPGVIYKYEIQKLQVGSSNGRIHLAMYDTNRTTLLKLKIWVLEEDYQWSLKCRFRCPEISDFYYTPVQSIGFHPYDEDVIFVSYYRGKGGLELKCLRYIEQNHIVENNTSFYCCSLSNLGNGPIYHLLQCEVPFACSKLQIKPLEKD